MTTVNRARHSESGPADQPRDGLRSRPDLGVRAAGMAKARVDPLTDRLLSLQARAGNAAVAALLAQRETAAGAPVADPPPTTVAAPPTEGKEVDRLGVIDNDTEGGGGLNLRASPGGTVLTRLAHNDHVMVKRELPQDWVYVVATDGASKGTAGYASRIYINTSMPPTPEDPDPGATLHRIPSGERAHDFVRRFYGAENIVAGQDQRFFTNVLQYVNEDAGRGRFFVKKMKMRKGGGGMFGSISMPYEDIELVAGGKIWVPSLAYAQSLKGTVSAGSFARDVWEKVKGIAHKAAAVPAFIAGLVVGAIESIKDLFVGLFELIWGTIKSLGANLVDAAKGIYGLVTDPRKRQVILEAIDDKLREMLYTGSFLRRAYNWGRIIGYATMEVVSFILLPGAAAAARGAKFGARLTKLFEVVKASEGVQKTLRAADTLRKSEAVIKLAAKVEHVAAGAAKLAAKAEPVTQGVKKVASAAGKVAGAPSEAALAASRLLSKQLRRLAARYGWSESRLAAVVGIVEQRGATVYLRKSSKWAPARLAEGAAPKPVLIKANTLDELDLILGGGQFRHKHLGLVAHFEPKPPGSWVRPRDMSRQRWNAIQAELRAKHKKRLDSFNKNEKEMKALTQPSTAPNSMYFEVKGGDKVKGGLVYQVELDDAAKAVRKPLAGDVDVFQFTPDPGRAAKAKRRGDGTEEEMLDDLFLEAGVSEHGAHMAWRNRSDFNEDAFFAIIDGHRKDLLVEVAPGGKVRQVPVEQVPGVAEVFASAEYKAWKARKSGRQ